MSDEDLHAFSKETLIALVKILIRANEAKTPVYVRDYAPQIPIQPPTWHPSPGTDPWVVIC